MKSKNRQENELPNYQIIRKIGKGCFGKFNSHLNFSNYLGYVFEAIDNKNKRKVAWKRIQKVGKQISREYEILAEMEKQENVVQVYDFFYSKTKEKKLIQNLIFEFIPNNLEAKL